MMDLNNLDEEDPKTLELLREAHELLTDYGDVMRDHHDMQLSISLLEQENLALKRLLGAPKPELTYKEVLKEKGDRHERVQRWTESLERRLRTECLQDKNHKKDRSTF